MRGVPSIRAAAFARPRAAVLVASAVVAAVPVALAADGSAERLRAQGEHLGATAAAVTLELYGLETQLAAAQAEVDRLAAERARLQAEREAVRRRLNVTKRAAAAAQRQLESLVRALYAQSAVDPLAILLGADSLAEALNGLEDLDRTATQSLRIGDQAASARRRLAQLDARLAARTARLAVVTAQAEARTQRLRERAAERAAYLADVRHQAVLTERQLARAEEQARAAQRRSAALQPSAAAPADPAPEREAPAAAAAPAAAPVAPPAAPPAPEAAAPPATGARTMRVTAVAYILKGTTASGLPTGPGIVAVDPTVIPLGTRLYVPGYGDAVAADTGGAIKGAMIDVWLPTLAQARAWGRRTVVITIR